MALFSFLGAQQLYQHGGGGGGGGGGGVVRLCFKAKPGWPGFGSKQSLAGQALVQSKGWPGFALKHSLARLCFKAKPGQTVLQATILDV